MRTLAAVLSLPLLFFAGCSSEPKQQTKKEEPKKDPEPITGRNAFYKIFVAGRSWAPDAQCIRVTSIPITEVKSEPGKAGAWQVTLASPSKLRKKSWTWSAVELPGNLHEGVFAGLEEGYDPNSRANRSFVLAALKIDTDAAYKVAAEKSAEFLKKNPDIRVNFQLELDDKHPNPAWRVYWGDSVGTSAHSVFVDATTGAYLETRH